MTTILSFSGTIALIRDIAIIALMIELLLFIFVLGFITLLLYKKVVPILRSANKATNTVEEISSNISGKLVKPLVSRSVFVLGAGQLLSLILGMSRKKRGDGEKDV